MIFFVSVVDFLHSMFLNDGRVVFSLFIILFRLSRFVSCSCDSVSLGFLDTVAYSFSRVGSSFLIGFFFFWLAPLDVFEIVLSCICVFRGISSISRSENHPFFIIVLTWSASLWLVVWKLIYSCQISIVLFIYPLCEGLLLKQQCSTSWLSSLVHFLRFGLWSLWLLMSSFMYLKREQPTFAGRQTGLSCWLSGEHLTIMTPKPVAWVPRFVILGLDIFTMDGILWLYQTQVCFWSTNLTQMWPRAVILIVQIQWVTEIYIYITGKYLKPMF